MQDDLAGARPPGERGRRAARRAGGHRVGGGDRSAASPSETADRILELVRDAFAAGMQWSFRLVAALALCGLIVSVLFVGGSPRTPAHECAYAGISRPVAGQQRGVNVTIIGTGNMARGIGSRLVAGGHQ